MNYDDGWRGGCLICEEPVYQPCLVGDPVILYFDVETYDECVHLDCAIEHPFSVPDGEFRVERGDLLLDGMIVGAR